MIGDSVSWFQWIYGFIEVAGFNGSTDSWLRIYRNGFTDLRVYVLLLDLGMLFNIRDKEVYKQAIFKTFEFMELGDLRNEEGL